MVGRLLWRGMLAGLVAAFVAALFALAVAEPQIDASIALEARHVMPGMAHEPALVSRAVQKTAGLFTAMTLYGAAVGGLFALVFAACLGRVGRIGPRGLALLLAAIGFVVIVAVPAIKYPPTPPAVGLHETVRLRTAAYFGMIALSVTAAMLAGQVRRAALPRAGSFDAGVAGGIAFIVLAMAGAALLPHVDEVPADFGASLLWRFRLASLGAQAIFWLGLGWLFGRLAPPHLPRAPGDIA